MGFKARPRGPAGSSYVKRKTIKRKKIKPPDASKWIYLVEAARETGLPRLAIVDLVPQRGRLKKWSAGPKHSSRARDWKVLFVSRARDSKTNLQRSRSLKALLYLMDARNDGPVIKIVIPTPVKRARAVISARVGRRDLVFISKIGLYLSRSQ